MSKHFDIVVVGSGGATKIAHHASNAGYRVAMIEKGPFGGTCVNRGCVPSKMLIYPADVVNTIKQGERLNVRAKGIEVDFQQLVRRVSSKIDSIAEKIQTNYESKENVQVYPLPCRFIADKTLLAGNEEISGERIYLAIGAHPHIPEIEGLIGTPFITSKEALRMEKKPRKLIILGGGFVAAEMGHFFSSVGVEVEILTRSGFLNDIDASIREVFLSEFKRTHLVHEFAQVKKVSHQADAFTVYYNNGQQKEEAVEGDSLLVATGMRAWTDDIGIENTSIELDAKGFIKVDQFLKTTADDTWAFGDCIGHALFRHMANFEGDYLKEQLLSASSRPIEYPPIPFAIFTHPQIGVVGKSEEDLIKEGFDVIAGAAEYKNSDMGLARRSETGLVKLLFDAKTRRLLSAHMVGDEAATMIHIAIAYIQKKATIEDITSTIFIHPALPEVLSSAAFNARNKL